jgi:hypothetical protein
VDAVILLHSHGKLLGLIVRELLAAQDLARLLDAHLELVQRVHNLVAAQHLAEVLGDGLQDLRLAEGQQVVLVRLPGASERTSAAHACTPEVVRRRTRKAQAG